MKKKLMCLLTTIAMMLTVAGSAVSAESTGDQLPAGLPSGAPTEGDQPTTPPPDPIPDPSFQSPYTITFPDGNISHEGGTVKFTITGDGLQDPLFLTTGQQTAPITIQNGIGTAYLTFPPNTLAHYPSYKLYYSSSEEGEWRPFTTANGQYVTITQDPSPEPRVEVLEPDLTVLPSTGGTVVVKITGQLLDTYVKGKAVYGSEETAVATCVNDPEGKGGSGSFTLQFPANTSSSKKVYSIHTSVSEGEYWEDRGVTITVEGAASSGSDSSGGSSVPYVPPVTIPTDTTAGNASGVKIEMQASQLPSGVEAKDVSFSAKPVEQESATVKAVEAVLASSNLPKAKDVAVYDLDLLLKSSGKKVTFTGKVKVAIPMPTGYGRFLRVFHVADDGAMTEVPAILNGSSIEVTLEHFSYYAVVDFKESAGANTLKLSTTSTALTSAPTSDTSVNSNTSKNPTTGSEAPYALLLGVLATSGILIRVKMKNRQKA